MVSTSKTGRPVADVIAAEYGGRLAHSSSQCAISGCCATACCVSVVHSLHATALACLRRSIPAFHYMIAEFGGDRIACSGYATYGSETLARIAVKALGPRHACLMANHGAVTLGDDLHQAFERALSLEGGGQVVRGRVPLRQRRQLPASGTHFEGKQSGFQLMLHIGFIIPFVKDDALRVHPDKPAISARREAIGFFLDHEIDHSARRRWVDDHQPSFRQFLIACFVNYARNKIVLRSLRLAAA